MIVIYRQNMWKLLRPDKPASALAGCLARMPCQGALPECLFKVPCQSAFAINVLIRHSESVSLFLRLFCPVCVYRSASPGRLGQLEDELFRAGDTGAELPLVMAVTLTAAEGQRQGRCVQGRCVQGRCVQGRCVRARYVQVRCVQGRCVQRRCQGEANGGGKGQQQVWWLVARCVQGMTRGWKGGGRGEGNRQSGKGGEGSTALTCALSPAIRYGDGADCQRWTCCSIWVWRRLSAMALLFDMAMALTVGDGLVV
eukprot:365029-Chlamydomonas_euryale.AAC.16